MSRQAGGSRTRASRARPRDGEAAASTEYRLLKGVAEATHRLLSQPDLDAGLRDALALLREAAGADRIYLYEFHSLPGRTERVFSQRFGWSRRRGEMVKDAPELQNIRYRDWGFGEWRNEFDKGRAVARTRGEAGGKAGEFLERHGIQSLLLVPVLTNGRLRAVIGFDDCTRPRRWSREEEAILHVMADSIGAALDRRDGEERWRRMVAILESTTDFVGYVDIASGEQYINRAGRRMIGLDEGAPLTGDLENAPRFMPDWARKLIREVALPIAARDGVWHGETALLTADGREIPVSQVIIAHKTENGRVEFFSTVARDIAESKRQERHLSAMVDLTKEIGGTLDLEEIFDGAQRRVKALFGCERVVIFQRDDSSRVFRIVSQSGMPEHLLPEAIAFEFTPSPEMAEAFAGGRAVTVNDVQTQPYLPVKAMRQNAVERWMAAPLLVRGRLVGILAVVNPLSGRPFDDSQAQLLEGIAQQLALAVEAGELYRAQQEEAQVASALARVSQEMITSLDTRVVLDRLCQLTTEVLGSDCSHTLLWSATDRVWVVAAGHGDLPEQWERIRAVRIRPEELQSLVDRLEHRDVVEIYREMSHDPVGATTGFRMALRRGGKLVGIHAASWLRGSPLFTRSQQRIAAGIGQIASMVLENLQLVDELERANKLKSDFVATMSHELRTPLNVILGYNDLLLDGAFGELPEEQRDAQRRIERSAWELLDLINATLDVSRIESGHLPVVVCRVRLQDLADDINRETREMQARPGLSLTWDIPADLPPLQSDPVKLKVILKNLVTNALKFTDEGEVAVHAKLENGRVHLVVDDTGIGIPPDSLETVFEPFRQLDASMTRRHGGVGLGLYITRRLCELMGGTVSVRSEVGKGSSFRVELPNPTPASAG